MKKKMPKCMAAVCMLLAGLVMPAWLSEPPEDGPLPTDPEAQGGGGAAGSLGETDDVEEAEELQVCPPGKENACRCSGMMWCYSIGGAPIPPFMCKLTRSAQADSTCSDLHQRIALDCEARARSSIGGGEWECTGVSKKTGATVLHCAGYLK